MRARIGRLARSGAARARRWTPPALLAVLSAGAFGPLLASGLGGAAVASAAIGALTAVGGNVLTDVVKAAVARLVPRPRPFSSPAGDDEPSDELLARFEEELERQFERVLQAGGEQARRLRREIAALLEHSGAVGAALQEAIASGDRELQARLTAGLAGLGREFEEFSFVLTEVNDRLEAIREGVNAQGARLETAMGL